MSHFHFSLPSLLHATVLRRKKRAVYEMFCLFVFITFVSENPSCVAIKKEEDVDKQSVTGKHRKYPRASALLQSL